MSAYRDRKLTLARATTAAVVALYRRPQDRDRFVVGAAGIVAAARGTAYALADTALAAFLATRTGRAVPALGLIAPDATDRLRTAVATLWDARPATVAADALDASREARLARFATAEPLDAAQRGFSEGLVRREIGGWTRETGPNPCPLCEEWADGSTVSSDVEMNSHAGCSCVQVPVLG